MNDLNTSENSFVTIQSGNWSNPLTWKGGVMPPANSNILVDTGHILVLDISVITCGVSISSGATLTFDPDKSCILDNCENIVNEGKLVMKPSSPSIIHLIKFHDIVENTFVGGGMEVLDTDPGLWFRETSTLDFGCSSKTAWTNLIGGVTKGSKTIIVKDSTGWVVGDEISIAPTSPISVSTFYNSSDVRTITIIIGNTITLNTPLTFDHPVLVNPFNSAIYTAEVLNLTRNVRIEGSGNGTADPTTNGRTHVHIMSQTPFTMSNVQFRNMGPRQAADQYTDDVLGRYAVHFHMCGDALRGSVIDGVVVRDSGSHAFVPHATHGITFKNCISYNTYEHAYWWDAPPVDKDTNAINNSNDITFDNCVAAVLKCDPIFRGYAVGSFSLGSGLRNTAKNCVAYGNQGNNGASGFTWPSTSNHTDNVWTFENNISHNNRTDGMYIWENDINNHIINNFIVYRNGVNGIEHGAYRNSFRYSNGQLINNKNGVSLLATPGGGIKDEYGYSASWNNVQSTDPISIGRHTLVGIGATLFKDCTFSKVLVNELVGSTVLPGLFDFVNCNLLPANFIITRMEVGSKIRVQDGNSAFQINDKGVISSIPLFLIIK